MAPSYKIYILYEVNIVKRADDSTAILQEETILVSDQSIEGALNVALAYAGHGNVLQIKNLGKNLLVHE